MSQYRGVTWHRDNAAWLVKFKYDGRTLNLGYWREPEIAARYRDVAVAILHGPAARLNFPTFRPNTAMFCGVVDKLAGLGAITDKRAAELREGAILLDV